MESDWIIDEKRHAGEEHLDPEQVASYDEKIPFDPTEEIDLLLEYGLSADDTVVDFGTGTGVFPLAVADYCDRVIAIDVSKTMVDVTREKVVQQNIDNIEIVHDGFVSYDHQDDLAGFVYSKNALHHLPDFWKVEALKTVGDSLKEGGIFRLRDLVYSFDPRDSHDEIERWLEEMESTKFTDEELRAHFREEFSTYDFVLEAMLEEIGFEILEATYARGFYANYTCNWHGNSE